MRALIPELKRWIPAGIDISVVSDRTGTIRASVLDMQYTLLATIVLVMLVVFVFLRRGTPTIAAGITVPLSLAGTCAAMWAVGYSINNLSLMALAVSVGFVVDDAIVMIENMFRNLEKGHSPLRAAYEGARQIGFTVVTISVSLIAAFIPLLFMDGVVGRRVPRVLAHARIRGRDLDVRLALGHADDLRAISSRRRRAGRAPGSTASSRRCWPAGLGLRAQPRRRAAPPRLTLIVLLATIGFTVYLYRETPQGLLPAGRHRAGDGLEQRGARHLVQGHGRAAAEAGRDRPRRPGGRERRLLGRRLGAGAARSTAAACSSR